ncbi:MAG: endonuclease I [Zunongwangia sp.]|jgi:endonuclease I|uniref:VcbS n=2 Tax=Zunongwangia profunda TaxID=398743 RepID=D5BCP5_ZUNPS|nr:Ig-like domain-containing protein [Zunongwangia profunda]ADF50558.1 VcbS [Zunongwangia profunda SM-A87]MAO37597.1 endonuclease I [Zunongwangia sp.]MAS69954.1 endonuclease I [Zunongwangia sp.]HCV82829.1 tandem-95 repeat protein [Zunongwangia profunda]|tara:strand:- start:3657 stop:5309 length:1653 start_codon:yes stop_codon:yes gene_type:complete
MKKNFFFAFLLGSFFLGCSSSDEGTPNEPGNPQEENPVAVDDNFSTIENVEVTFSGNDILQNDEIVDKARLFSIDIESSEGGTISDNRDGTYTYVPPADFHGEDTFMYSLCVPGDSDRCSEATVTIQVDKPGPPTANDDTYEVAEDGTLTIRNYGDNDDLVGDAMITEVESSSGNATVSIDGENNIIYEPNEGFAGSDTFTYTICNDDENTSCDTATVTIEVIDEGNPYAEDDTVIVNTNDAETIFAELLANDNLIDGATLTSIDGSSSEGTVTLNNDGSVTYVPSAGFTGEDTFEYSICDDDQPEASCSTATVTVQVVAPIAFNIPADLQDYYDDVTFTENSDFLKLALSNFTVAAHETILAYTDRHDYLYSADADPDTPGNVILMYSGESRSDDEYQTQEPPGDDETFNTEHIYPQSRLSAADAVTDLHHLRSIDIDVNSERSNYPFADGNGEYGLVGNNEQWYPGDDWKGDVARMVFYLNIRYGENIETVGNLDLFLKWNREDPVSEFEMQRNNVIEAAQGNRNPFIDNPYLVTLIWGGSDAENRWE